MATIAIASSQQRLSAITLTPPGNNYVEFYSISNHAECFMSVRDENIERYQVKLTTLILKSHCLIPLNN